MLNPQRIVLLVVGVLAALASPARAVLLVNPDGAPVGGQWQRRADHSKVKTIHRSLMFTIDPGECPGDAFGCSYKLDRINISIPAGTDERQLQLRETLYFELGHQFDWARLTAQDRHWFMRNWSIGHRRWWDTRAALDAGYENGGQGLFAAIYEGCAIGHSDKGWSTSLFAPAGKHVPQAHSKLDSCLRIEQIATRAGTKRLGAT